LGSLYSIRGFPDHRFERAESKFELPLLTRSREEGSLKITGKQPQILIMYTWNVNTKITSITFASHPE